MLISICKAKIHQATVTEANLNYEGSITIDKKIMEQVKILPYEKVQVVNLNNGSRFDTYVIVGKANSGIICLNGPAARLGQKGDKVIIIAYAMMEEDEATGFKPKLVYVDGKNKVIKKTGNTKARKG